MLVLETYQPYWRIFFFCVSAAKDKGEKKLFGFAFTPLMREDGTTLSDESHELYVYKVRTTSAIYLLDFIQLLTIIFLWNTNSIKLK